jgi:hypothetical protein
MTSICLYPTKNASDRPVDRARAMRAQPLILHFIVHIQSTTDSSIIRYSSQFMLNVYSLAPPSLHFFLTSPFHLPYNSHPNTNIIGIPTIIAVTRLAAGLYFGGNRVSGDGSMSRLRGRTLAGAGGAGRVAGGAFFGDGARSGEDGRGIVVVR